MTKHHLAMTLASVVIFLSACGATSSPIAGTWKHADKAAWVKIEFNQTTGSASVVKHDENASAEGQLLIKEIMVSSRSNNQWRGKIYAAAVDDFIEASLMLTNDDSLVVSTYADSETSEKTPIQVLRLIRS